MMRVEGLEMGNLEGDGVNGAVVRREKDRAAASSAWC